MNQETNTRQSATTDEVADYLGISRDSVITIFRRRGELINVLEKQGRRQRPRSKRKYSTWRISKQAAEAYYYEKFGTRVPFILADKMERIRRTKAEMRKDEQDAMDLAKIQILPQERQKKLQEWASQQMQNIGRKGRS